MLIKKLSIEIENQINFNHILDRLKYLQKDKINQFHPILIISYSQISSNENLFEINNFQEFITSSSSSIQIQDWRFNFSFFKIFFSN
jgi:hypothetical protein